MTTNKRLERLIRQYESCRITKEELRKYLEKGVLGRVTGIVGPFVLRYQGDKLVISDRALDYNKSMTEASIEGRNNFAVKVKFAQFLNSIEEIREIWGKADIGGRLAWNRLIKYNDIKGKYPTVNNIITPEKYHFIVKQLCSLTKDFSININHNKSGENDKLYIVLVPYNPVNMCDEPFCILRINGNSLTEEQISLCRRYKRYILYTALTRRSGDNIEWSNTTAVEGIISFVDRKCDEESVLNWLFLVKSYLTADKTKKPQRLQQRIYTLRL